ncbi:MAG: OsmC family protein [Candidatus Dormibacterales bacterium]
MQSATARWTGRKTTFEIESASGHRATIDEPPVLGDDAGMRPTEMLLGALGGCTGLNAVLLLKKFRQPFESLAVHIEGVQEEEWPKRFTGIRVEFEIAWTGDFDEELVSKALDMACNKYCPVDATLSRGTRVTVARSDRRAPAPPFSNDPP